VVIGGELYSDAMGAPGTYEGTYLGMIDHNTPRFLVPSAATRPAKRHAGTAVIGTR
jgi:manganese/zinc/iron transport system substrate-binding protein